MVSKKWLLVFIIGILVMADGIGSILWYYNQGFPDHLTRIARFCAGLILAIIAMKSMKGQVSKASKRRARQRTKSAKTKGL
jgi:NhaP-type Na+/H+ and K+/H+ antiporter